VDIHRCQYLGGIRLILVSLFAYAVLVEILSKINQTQLDVFSILLVCFDKSSVFIQLLLKVGHDSASSHVASDTYPEQSLITTIDCYDVG